MKQMVLTGIRHMELREVEKPRITGDRDVLIRVTKVGVCGSDVHYYTTGRIGSQIVDYPFAVGHECAGVVEETGSATTRVRAGDSVAIDPAMPCFQCDQCAAGRFHTCRRLRFLGCPGQAEGCLGEFLVMPETSVYPLPAGMTQDEAVISEPLAIGVYAVRQSGEIRERKIGILGAGPIGLSVLLPAKAWGAASIYVTDKIEARLALARRLGADWTGNPDAMDVAAGINAEEPLQLDVAYECCGQQDAIDNAIDILKPGGKLMVIGIPEADRLSFSIDKMRRKEITIVNVRRQNECVDAALDLLQTAGNDASAMITHRFPFSQTPEAFDLVSERRDGVVKAMIEFGDD
ncbi:MAG TPA: alcohol dehydrogenase catalytic domain-containing protein [Candidatus Hydrogenedentes bacterium]|nr:alcohol dehydrogenase catalytic domain-containing protein [Candidatus Hydrogenedentota bacterium]HOS02655.1 alcohol dehydrogenase catalytic domain-containing protein [Candidatus Hydrogenedentota bacterium]